MSLNIINLSGDWLFHEDFHYGSDEGTATLKQKGQELSGTMTFIETIEGESPFTVECIITGTCESKEVTLKSSQHRIVEGDTSIEYLSETRQGFINSQGQIIGSSIDEEGVEGVFVFSRRDS